MTDLSKTLKINKYWTFYDDINSPYWSPNRITYDSNSIVYNSGDWYIYNIGITNSVDFWNPYVSLQYGLPNFSGQTTINSISPGYQKGTVVIYKGFIYQSLIDYNYQTPDYNQSFRTYD